MRKSKIVVYITRVADELDDLKEDIDSSVVGIDKRVDPVIISTKSKLEGIIRELNELAIESMNSND